MTLHSEKIAQAKTLVKEAGLDAWITFVRETAEGSDPILPFLIEGGLTWQSALVIFANGKSVAVVGNYDADPLKHSGDWDEVVPYVQGIKDSLLAALEANIPAGKQAAIGLNISEDDCKADGLTVGMYRLMEKVVAGTRFEGCLEPARGVPTRLRGEKTSTEIARLKKAIEITDEMFAFAQSIAKVGVSERAVYRAIQEKIDAAGFGYGWDRAGNPIVNSGPNSMIGHGIPSDSILIEEGHIFHIDLGVIVDGYSSDIQRCWFVGDSVPEDVQKGLAAVRASLEAAKAVLKPGVQGWQVDDAARSTLVAHGYPEYLHAVGHQVGRAAHDGGAVLGPKWDRYGNTPMMPIRENEVYTLELGVTLPGRGYLGLEEMVLVTADGCEWLSTPQTSMPLL